jgi:N utilization substance protein B
MPIRKRSQARMLAMQALCVFDAVGDAFADRLDEFLGDPHVYEDLGLPETPPNDVLEFARRLALGTWQHRARYDELLSRHAEHWSLNRMPPVDRNILRLGVHELHEQDADRPPQVVINEAVELARRFGGADSPAFVNGLLDAIRRSLEAGEDDSVRPG